MALASPNTKQTIAEQVGRPSTSRVAPVTMPTISSSGVDLLKLTPIIEAVQAIEAEVNILAKERAETIRAVLLGIMAKEHAVILGKPGTGKSYMVRELTKRFCDSAGTGLKLWQWQFTAFTEPAALLGPVDVSKLLAGVQEYQIGGKFPEAEVAILDEIFRATRVLELLLSILNEREFYNGTGPQSVPLMAAFATTNMLAQEEDLAAVYDRFLIRLETNYLSQPGFSSLIRDRAAKAQLQVAQTTVHRDDLRMLQAAVDNVLLPNAVLDAIEQAQREFGRLQMHFSDRRWVQALRLIQAHALLEGRGEADTDDVMCLTNVFWDTQDEIPNARKVLGKLGNPANARANELLDASSGIFEEWKLATSEKTFEETDVGTKTALHAQAATKLQRAQQELENLQNDAISAGRSTTRIDGYSGWTGLRTQPALVFDDHGLFIGTGR